jgi:enoyl-CoA hydratase
MSYKNLLVEIDNKIATVYINRPKKLNALNKETLSELHNAFKTLRNDDSVRVIVLTGSGEKAFVAGADISEFANFNKNQGADLARQGQELVFDYIENMNKPVIAAINGFALGGGLELAMACHFRIASDNAKMGLPEVSLGVIPGYGGTQRLTNLIGKGKAMEMITTATMIDANEAKEYKLVNHTTTYEQLLEFTYKIASKILRNSSTAISASIKAINASTNKEINGFETEINEFGNCFGTKDFIEGTTAFLEKRKPNFK